MNEEEQKEKEISDAYDALKEAAIEKMRIEARAAKIEPARRKAHKKFLLARDTVQGLKGY